MDKVEAAAAGLHRTVLLAESEATELEVINDATMPMVKVIIGTQEFSVHPMHHGITVAELVQAYRENISVERLTIYLKNKYADAGFTKGVPYCNLSLETQMSARQVKNWVRALLDKPFSEDNTFIDFGEVAGMVILMQDGESDGGH